MNTRSIRFRLITWYAGLLIAVFVLMGGVIYEGLQSYLKRSLSEAQFRRARQIADTLLSEDGRAAEARAASEINAWFTPETNDRFIRITREDGTSLYLSRNPKDAGFDPAEVPPVPNASKTNSWRTQAVPQGRTLLIASVSSRSLNGRHYLVEVGTPLDPVQDVLKRLLILLGVGLAVMVAVAISGGYFLIRRALEPVDEIARSAEQISMHNLKERLPAARTRDELERLSDSLNRMIARLDDAFQHNKRFIADASHELRTPLTIMRGELESIVEGTAATPDVRETAASVLEEVERLARIVEGLFSVARLDAGEAQNECVRFDLAELADSTADQMCLLAEDKGITIACSAPKAVMVEGDRARLKQVVVNLLDNAIKYTPEGGKIRLTVAGANGHAQLEVEDNGIGIPAEAHGHIFERFFRVDKARSREMGGAGLGLSIVKSICTAHGGRVDFQSKEGAGSRFKVELPIAREKNGHEEIKHGH